MKEKGFVRYLYNLQDVCQNTHTVNTSSLSLQIPRRHQHHYDISIAWGVIGLKMAVSNVNNIYVTNSREILFLFSISTKLHRNSWSSICGCKITNVFPLRIAVMTSKVH